MASTASSRVRPPPTVLSISMMSRITRIRTVRRRSSRLWTWLYSDGPLVPSWLASALIVSASQPSRSRQVRAALTMESRLSLVGRPGLRDRPPADSGRAAIVLSPFGSASRKFRVTGQRRTLVDPVLTELSQLPGNGAQIGQAGRIQVLDRPRDDIVALGHIDTARVGVGGLETLVAVDRQFGQRAAGLGFQ